ncbi:MAG: hypothetical protein K1W19_04115 [Lachnospiraceae bacterium]
MRAVNEVCDDLERIIFRYEGLTALIDIIQEAITESPSHCDGRLSLALHEIIIGLEENNDDINNLLVELRSISKIQEIKHDKD